MAKTVIYIEQQVLDRISRRANAQSYETEKFYYLPIGEKIEIVPSPRPVDRDHFRRDFASELKSLESAIEDLQTIARHLGYMKSEI